MSIRKANKKTVAETIKSLIPIGKLFTGAEVQYASQRCEVSVSVAIAALKEAGIIEKVQEGYIAKFDLWRRVK